MKIAVNTRFLLPDKLEGIGKFTFETLRHMVASHPEATFYFFFDRPYDHRFIFRPNVIPVVLSPPARHPFLFFVWFERSVAAMLKRLKPDVFLSTDGLTTLNTSVPRVTVVHDLAFEHYPKDIGWLVRKYLQFYSPRFAAASKRLIAVSEATRQDLVSTYQVKPEKIDVVYNAPSDFFTPIPETLKTEIKQRFTSSKPYFIFVGAIQPRKNLVNLFSAFDLFKSETASEIKLLIVGRKAWKSKDITRAYEKMRFRDDVIFTGRVSDDDLKNLYGAALASVYVPTFEGFGIPIVEAQKCDCPVITSNVSSMPEVAGEAALLVDPFSVTAIAAGLKTIATDPALRTILVRKGQENLKRFSWQQSADRLWGSLVKAGKETEQ